MGRADRLKDFLFFLTFYTNCTIRKGVALFFLGFHMGFTLQVVFGDVSPQF